MNSNQQAIASNGNWSETYDLANLYVKQERWLEAIAAYYRAIELNSSFFWSYHNLGEVLIQLQRWDEAAAIYRRAIELDSNFFWSHHNLGDVLIQLQRWDEAIAAYFQAIKIDLNAPLIYQKLGTAFKERGNLTESIQYYRQVIRNPKQYPIYGDLSQLSLLLCQIANNLVQKHQIPAAIICYYMMLEIEPERLELLPQLEKLLQKHHRLQKDINFRQQQIACTSQRLSHYHSAIGTTKTNCRAEKREKFLFTSDRNIPPHLLESLCQTVGWQPRALNRVQKAIARSFLIVAIWETANHPRRLIGFARVVSDGVFHATILDLVIHPEFQNRGLGKSTISYIIKQLQTVSINDIILLASPAVVDFYQSLGFIPEPNNLKWMLWCPKN